MVQKKWCNMEKIDIKQIFFMLLFLAISHAKDKGKVYFQEETVVGVDYKTFKVHLGSYYARDKSWA